MKLELFYPAKPYIVTQAFGLLNSSYKDNGMTFIKHNGIDFKVDTDGIVRAMCDLEVYEVGENSKAGRYVRLKTLNPVEAEGKVGTVAFMYMHADRHLCKQGDILKAGDPVIVADNTGFSTGPHTHISAYFINSANVKLEGDPDVDHCFDFSKYYNNYYSDDATQVYLILTATISILGMMIALFN
jgi:murein DD-endopeptidase MepM/ murein hydrolase activator NlpD